MVEVTLADGNKRKIQSMTATSFWSADGTPMSAAQFMENLFGAMPEFFKDEDQLRAIWSDPATRNIMGLIDKYPDVARNGIRLRRFGQNMA